MASAIMMINPHGEEVLVNHDVIRWLKNIGIFHQYHRQIHKYPGTGPENKVCLLVNVNGLGDDLHSMPAIAQKIADGHEVSIGGLDDYRANRMFNAKIFTSLGCQLIPCVEKGFIDDNLQHYSAIHSLKMWCLEHDWDTKGDVELTRFDQFARHIETPLPESFSWIDHLRPERPTRRRDMIILAMTSSSVRRSYGDQLSLLQAYQEHNLSARLIGGVHKGGKVDSFEELIDLIYHARLVVAVDNGILALALALETPVLAVFGPTDENTIVWQFKRYVNTDSVRVLRSDTHDVCRRPCSFQGERGHSVNGKCKPETYSDCIVEITPQMIFKHSLHLLN